MNTSEKIIKTLNEGRVRFTYTKTDGTVREAYGTTKQDLIPEAARAEANNNADSQVVSYFDLDRNDWRSARKESIKADSIKAEA